MSSTEPRPIHKFWYYSQSIKKEKIQKSRRRQDWYTGRTIWGGLFDAVPDLTNREESIFADTEVNVCIEVVLHR